MIEIPRQGIDRSPILIAPDSRSASEKDKRCDDRINSGVVEGFALDRGVGSRIADDARMRRMAFGEEIRGSPAISR